MSLSEATLTAMLQGIADNIQKVHKDCTAIGNAAAAMYDVVEKDCFPTLAQVQEVWQGGTSNKYVQKTNAKMNDIVQDCLDIRKAAEDILAAYLEYSKQQIRSLGLDPHEIMPGVF